MAQPYIGEIRMFAGSFAPAGWAFCDGQLMPISENDALFVLIGTTYGGDGQETFALPNLQSRVPIHMGTAPSATTYQLAETGGVEEVSLTVNQIPAHTHALTASLDQANTLNAGGNEIGTPLTATPLFAAAPNVNFSPNAITPVGGSQPHTNLQPYLCVSFIISLFGLFPSQT